MILETMPPKTVPRHLIYEMDRGKPIFYKGYENMLSQQNYIDTMPDSNLQWCLKEELVDYLKSFFKRPEYMVGGGELGLLLEKDTWRAADVAILKRENFRLDNKYAKLPPEIVVEINLKGHYDSPQKATEDFERKNAQLLKFGVKKIIWIFTDSKTALIVSPEGREKYTWNDAIPVLGDVTVNIQELIDRIVREMNLD